MLKKGLKKKFITLTLTAVLLGNCMDLPVLYVNAATISENMVAADIAGAEDIKGGSHAENPDSGQAENPDSGQAESLDGSHAENLDSGHAENLDGSLAGSLMVTGGTMGTDYSYADDVLTIQTGTALVIKNVDENVAATTKILIKKDVSANITLAGVNIDVSATQGACAFLIEDDSTGNVTITLEEETVNRLTSGFTCAGIQKNGNGEDIGKLTITGSGTLYASASKGPATTDAHDSNGGGAGIGGGQRKDASNITISGGVVYATGAEEGNCTYTTSYSSWESEGYQSGAGIGGGYYGKGSNILITGGTVIANGSESGAGIGGGFGDSGSDITICGGCVTAIGQKGAGIGGGSDGKGQNIVITGGSVYADGFRRIGGGEEAEPAMPTDGNNTVLLYEVDNPDNEIVLIDGEEYKPYRHGTTAADQYCAADKLYVYLPGGDHTFMIGNDEYIPDMSTNMNTDLVVTGQDVIYGVDYLYPKGEGLLTILSSKPMTIANNSENTYSYTRDTICVAKDVSANITLAGVVIDVRYEENKTAFLIPQNSTGDVTITLAEGTINYLESSYYKAGIEKENTESGKESIGTLEITGEGTLIATGGEKGAGIGGSRNGDTSCIVISGGIINATGGNDGAGIGGGESGNGSDISITGGSVLATPGEGASAIGGGYNGNGDIVIMNGNRAAYPYTIANPNKEMIKVDEREYKPNVHIADNTIYNEIYIYLTAGENHTIQVGNNRMTAIRYDETIGEFVQIPAPDMFTVTMPEKLVYDKTVKGVTVVPADENIGEVTVKYYQDGKLMNEAPVLPGTYSVKIDVTATDSYASVTDLTCEEWTYTIEKAKLSVTGASAVSKKYDGTNIVKINGVSLTGILTGDEVNVDVTTLTGSVSSPDAGEYTEVVLQTLTLIGKDAVYYTLLQPTGAVPSKVTIHKSDDGGAQGSGGATGDNGATDNGENDKQTIVKGKVYKDDSGKAYYKVTKVHNKNGTVEYKKPVSKKATKVTIPATIKLSGITYKVTGISKNAFKNNKKIKTLTIGKNVNTIGSKAFYGCKKLKNITIKSKKLTTKKVGKNAFKGIYKKATIKVPKSKLKAYKSLLIKRGVSKKATIKKNK